MKRALYVLSFVLGLASAGGLSATVVAETLPTTAATATTTTTNTTTTVATPTTTTTTVRTSTTTATTTRPVTTTRPAPTTRHTTTTSAPPVIPARVRVANVPVGGLRPAAASAAVRAAFARPLAVFVNGKRFRLHPVRLAAAYVDGAVARARASAPGARVKLVVVARGASVRAVAARLARQFSRAPVDARLSFRDARPVVSPERVGHVLDQQAVTRAVVRALTRNTRAALRFKTTTIEPDVTRAGVGPVIVINRSLNRLGLYHGMTPWRTFGVATGQSVYPTPRGLFSIAVMYRNPWWYPPTSSSWARGLQPVPPGPGNPLGTRWMGLTAPGVGIHGTPDAASIGYSASHGCIRMRIPEAEWLFEHVSVGTPVLIV